MTRQRTATTPVPFPVPSAAPEARWFVTRGGKTAGPVTAQAIAQKLSNGSLSWSTLVWRDGMDGWIPARDAPEFAPSAPRPRVVDASSVFAVPDAPGVEVAQPGQATRLILVQAGLGRARWKRAVLGAVGVMTALGAMVALLSSRPQAAAPQPQVRVVVPVVEVEPAPAPTPPVEALVPRKDVSPQHRRGKHGSAPAAPKERARVRLPDVEVESTPHSNTAQSDAIRDRLGARPSVKLPGIDVSSDAAPGLSATDVERVVGNARGGMERCVQRSAKNGTRVSRALSLQLGIRPDGKVGEAKVRSGAGQTDAVLEECILNVVFGLRFPRAGAGGLDVEVPLRLRTR